MATKYACDDDRDAGCGGRGSGGGGYADRGRRRACRHDRMERKKQTRLLNKLLRAI